MGDSTMMSGKKSPMILWEMVQKVLSEHGGILTVEEISQQNKLRDLFRKKDGTFPDSSYLLFGIKNYPDKFEVIVRLKE